MAITNANDHPFKVALINATDGVMYANSHPYKVALEDGKIGFEAVIVDELPETGDPNNIYFILKESTPEGDIYDEWMWVLQPDETYGWSHIGTTDTVEIKLYGTTGNHTDGAMTQKATTQAIHAVKSDLDTLSENVEEISEQVDTLETDLATEVSERTSADTTLQGNINQEAQSRANADTALGTRIDNVETNLATEVTNRTNADTTLQTNIDSVAGDLADEVSAREQADQALQESISDLGDDKQDKLIAGNNIQIAADGKTISATDTTYTHFTGATASTDGVQGLVPGPLAGDEDKVLKGDGTWGEVSTARTLTDAEYEALWSNSNPLNDLLENIVSGSGV